MLFRAWKFNLVVLSELTWMFDNLSDVSPCNAYLWNVKYFCLGFVVLFIPVRYNWLAANYVPQTENNWQPENALIRKHQYVKDYKILLYIIITSPSISPLLVVFLLYRLQKSELAPKIFCLLVLTLSLH